MKLLSFPVWPGRLILIGSYMEHTTVNDEAAKDRLMKGLDSFLERDRDRELFDLPPLPAGNHGGQ